MASLNDFRVYQPAMTNLSDDIINAYLIVANLWATEQTSQGQVFSAVTKTRATCAYTLSLVSEGLAFDKAKKTGTIKLQDRGEVTVPKEAINALLGMSNHYSSQAQSLIVECLIDPATIVQPEAVGVAWSF
jgi:hypothetical protein